MPCVYEWLAEAYLVLAWHHVRSQKERFRRWTKIEEFFYEGTGDGSDVYEFWNWILKTYLHFNMSKQNYYDLKVLNAVWSVIHRNKRHDEPLDLRFVYQGCDKDVLETVKPRPDPPFDEILEDMQEVYGPGVKIRSFKTEIRFFSLPETPPETSFTFMGTEMLEAIEQMGGWDLAVRLQQSDEWMRIRKHQYQRIMYTCPLTILLDYDAEWWSHSGHSYTTETDWDMAYKSR
eukprot:Protomagalhaensia_wolfi_Nauph_80__1254@NODE_1740_length_1369_cov_470_377444_g826_i1_p1_GENE_NODE_1740_length_1369_cov_470_377444_g826_i1NODE_1740_length_1369_cov_470_377444_g826_i1_p1_ORF_typecomplete_len232_score40_20_NODE_1740_length_1369_cov_470_377444_g826_i1269964